MPEGIIVKGIGGFYYVECGDEVYECKARGIFRKDGITPLIGDRVDFTVIDRDKRLGNVDGIHPRHSELVRPSVANIDQVVLVLSAKSPSPDTVLLNKLLVTAEFKKLDIVIVINKIDLDHEKAYLNLEGIYSGAGYRVIPMTCMKETGDTNPEQAFGRDLEEAAGMKGTNVGLLSAAGGLDALLECLEGKISVFSGQSGVGKSSVLNRILQSKVMETGSVSKKIERGKHTTRHAELMKLQNGGHVVDTPGFSSFELEGIELEDLPSLYPEFETYMTGCRFSPCNHMSEPDCRVKDAVEAGKISFMRYESYKALFQILKEARDNVYRDKDRAKLRKGR